MQLKKDVPNKKFRVSLSSLVSPSNFSKNYNKKYKRFISITIIKLCLVDTRQINLLMFDVIDDKPEG